MWLCGYLSTQLLIFLSINASHGFKVLDEEDELMSPKLQREGIILS